MLLCPTSRYITHIVNATVNITVCICILQKFLMSPERPDQAEEVLLSGGLII